MMKSSTLDGCYRLIRELGRGTTGTVYEAQDRFGHRMAITLPALALRPSSRPGPLSFSGRADAGPSSPGWRHVPHPPGVRLPATAGRPGVQRARVGGRADAWRVAHRRPPRARGNFSGRCGRGRGGRAGACCGLGSPEPVTRECAAWPGRESVVDRVRPGRRVVGVKVAISWGRRNNDGRGYPRAARISPDGVCGCWPARSIRLGPRVGKCDRAAASTSRPPPRFVMPRPSLINTTRRGGGTPINTDYYRKWPRRRAGTGTG